MLRGVLGSPFSDRRRWVPAIVGAVIPLAFLFADPIVFRSRDEFLSEGTIFGDLRAFGYTAALLAATLLIRVLVSSRARTYEAGMLYAAAVVAAALGVVILPLSVIGMFLFGIGLLGLSPFFASWVYFRNAARVHAAATSRPWSRGAALGAVAFVSIAVAAQMGTNAAVSWAIRQGDSRIAAQVLSIAPVIYDPETLVRQYESATLQEKQQLALAYRRMTGELIEKPVAQVAD